MIIDICNKVKGASLQTKANGFLPTSLDFGTVVASSLLDQFYFDGIKHR